MGSKEALRKLLFSENNYCKSPMFISQKELAKKLTLAKGIEENSPEFEKEMVKSIQYVFQLISPGYKRKISNDITEVINTEAFNLVQNEDDRDQFLKDIFDSLLLAQQEFKETEIGIVLQGRKKFDLHSNFDFRNFGGNSPGYYDSYSSPLNEDSD